MPSRSPPENQRDRKRKNADAQAQFRQRRANYISSLEETVTKLEAVVLELQDSLRDAKDQNEHATAEKLHLIHLVGQLSQEHRSRELEWKTAWESKLPDCPLPVQIPPSHPEGISPTDAQAPPYATPCLDPALRFGMNLKDKPSLPTHLDGGAAPYAFNMPMKSPRGVRGGLVPSEASNSPAAASPSVVLASGDQSPISLPAIRRRPDGGFDVPSGPPFNSNDSAFALLPRISPLFTSPDGLPAPFLHEDRSVSPRSPHASSSSAATSSSSHIHYMPEQPSPSMTNTMTFRSLNNGESSKRRHEPTRRRGSDSYQTRRTQHRFIDESSTGSHPGAPQMRTFSIGTSSDNGRLTRNRREDSASPPISNTLAVIKAQAFGALRRNRASRRRGTGNATKVALQALEARGLGLGLEPTTTMVLRHQMESTDEEEGEPNQPLKDEDMDDLE